MNASRFLAVAALSAVAQCAAGSAAFAAVACRTAAASGAGMVGIAAGA